MEGIIEANKHNYYLALRRTQQTIRKEKQNWEYWLMFFLKVIPAPGRVDRSEKP